MFRSNYALFYDFHTDFNNPETGKNFDAEKTAEEFRKCGADFVTWHARCNQGSAYYDTHIGKKNPALKTDLVRDLAEACHKRGIRFSIYMNGELSDQELIEHPEWMVVPHKDDPYRIREPFFRRACLNSPFREHLKKMVAEAVEHCHADGLFIDCMLPVHCTCPVCRKRMEERGLDPEKTEDQDRFGNAMAEEVCRELRKVLDGISPDLLFFMNGRPFEEVSDIETHLEFECLPTNPEWGYECLPAGAHYLRTVAGGKTVLNMTGRFNDWGDFGGLRTAAALEYDLFYGIANGMRPDIGGHFHPRGDLDQSVFDRIREVYHTLQQYDPWVLGAVNTPEIAICAPRANGHLRPDGNSVSAAVRVLTELKCQFDLVTEFSSWEKYDLLIFPDDVPFTEETVSRVRKHLAKGGKILATGTSGLQNGKFVPGEFWPAVYQMRSGIDPLYYKVESRIGEGLPQMPLSVYASGGAEVLPADGAERLMRCIEPYFNYGWDGLRTHYYEAPARVTEKPFLLKKGNILYCSARIFEGYFKMSADTHRTLIGNMIRELLPEPKIRVQKLPCFSRVFVQEKEDLELVHLLAYAPEFKGHAIALDDRAAVLHGEFSLRLRKGEKLSKVCSVPAKQEIVCTEKDGYAVVKLPPFEGYMLLVFEYESSKK